MSSLPALLQAIGSLTTATAVCAAGGWTLYNFGLRRIGKARVQLQILPSGIEATDHGYCVYISLEATNNGNTKVKLDRAYVRITPLATANSGSILLQRLTPAEPPKAYEVFDRHTFLEPNERFKEDIAFQCRTLQPLQFDLEFWGSNNEDHSWMASRIMHFGQEANDGGGSYLPLDHTGTGGSNG